MIGVGARGVGSYAARGTGKGRWLSACLGRHKARAFRQEEPSFRVVPFKRAGVRATGHPRQAHRQKHPLPPSAAEAGGVPCRCCRPPQLCPLLKHAMVTPNRSCTACLYMYLAGFAGYRRVKLPGIARGGWAAQGGGGTGQPARNWRSYSWLRISPEGASDTNVMPSFEELRGGGE